jgi:hypothetical protein
MSIKNKIDEIFSVGAIGDLFKAPLQEMEDHDCDYDDDGICTVCGNKQEEESDAKSEDTPSKK